MTNQTIVKIIYSPELVNMKLTELIGCIGVIVDNSRKSGCWVELDEQYQNESEWFIPNQSLQIID